ncbi:MAG: hypothetical protein J6Y32_08830 [Bacteroidales bacterium]|nr:hypothetical protein [Bacteroidales bacterium]
MKRLVLVFVAILFSFILGSCQEKIDWVLDIDVVSGNIEPTEDGERVNYEEIMSVSGGNPQGGDSWGDYFFQFSANNSNVRVYDLATKTLVQTIKITSSLKGFVSNCHCNTVCFGKEYYDVEDIFPLIYVSTGYASGGYTGALVYRIVQHNGIFFITLVQTIKFPVGSSSWTEFVPGDEFAYLCYTTERIIYKIEMPKLKDGDIIIGPDSAIETYQFSPQPDWMASSRNQDRMFHQGKIYVASGVPQSGEASVLFILNLETKERERIIDLKKNGLTKEPESIFIWQGDVCIAFLDKIVRLVL